MENTRQTVVRRMGFCWGLAILLAIGGENKGASAAMQAGSGAGGSAASSGGGASSGSTGIGSSGTGAVSSSSTGKSSSDAQSAASSPLGARGNSSGPGARGTAAGGDASNAASAGSGRLSAGGTQGDRGQTSLFNDGQPDSTGTLGGGSGRTIDQQTDSLDTGRGGNNLTEQDDANLARQDLNTRSLGRGQAHLGVVLRDAGGLGVEVTKVEPGTAAERAGVRVGDQITAVNQQRVGRTQEVKALVAQLKPQAPVELEILRDGRFIDVRADLGAAEAALAGQPNTQSRTVMRPDSAGTAANIDLAGQDVPNARMDEMMQEIKSLREELNSLRQEIQSMKDQPGKMQPEPRKATNRTNGTGVPSVQK